VLYKILLNYLLTSRRRTVVPS